MPIWLDHLLNNYAALLIALLGGIGAGIGAVGAWRVNARKAKTEQAAQMTTAFTQAIDGFKDLLAAHRALLEDARMELAAMRLCNSQLVTRVAELQAEVTLHKAKIADLERENLSLKAEIEQLKARGRKPARRVVEGA